ncbi:MAG: arsenate reductase (glutaredoxin) [Planctomycetota bacterium]|nr:arsenate reductase (glutaredoxin) [Planctomycetota bacterium]
MAKVTIYHSTTCSKSREALALLKDKKVDLAVVKYLETPLDKATIQKLVKLVGGDPEQLLRKKDAKFAAAGLDPKKTYSAAEVVEVLAKHGEVMERPVIVCGTKAVIARPTEKALEVLK